MIYNNLKPGKITIILEMNQNATDLPTITYIHRNTTETITVTNIGTGHYNLISTNGIFKLGKTLVNKTRTGNPVVMYSKNTINDYYLQSYALTAYTIDVNTKKTSDLTSVNLSEIESPILLEIEIFNTD